MTNAGSHDTQAGIPEITLGSRVTNYGALDISVSGMASGGMGLVAWGPNRARGGKMQAVKLPRPDRLAAADPQKRAEILADFEREALTWCHLWAHPCIVAAEGLLRLSGLGDLPAIFLEYAAEGSLRDQLSYVHRPGSTQALGLLGAFVWGQMIASALAAIHQPAPDLERPEPLVHCDLKPENVLLSAKGWAMLTDLGLTRALASLADTASPPDVDVASLSTIIMGATAMGPSSQSDQPDQGNLAGLGALTAEQRAQVAQVRRLLAQAGVVPQPPVSSSTASLPVLPEDALYGTRTICVSPAQQAALAQAAAQLASVQPAQPAVSPSATAMIAQMGSRGPVAGTPQYMSPEQWLGLDAVVPASDVYALGVLLFELFAGVGGRAGYPHTPDPLLVLTAGPYAAWCAAHASGPSRHLADPEVRALSDGPLIALMQEGQQARAEQVLAGLDTLTRRCLAFTPAARPTARQVREQLAELAAQAGLDPLTIPEYPRIPDGEAAFWGNLAITYGEVGQHEEKLRLLRKAVHLTPDNLQLRETLGNALGELGRAEQQSARRARAAGDHARAQALDTQGRAHLDDAVRTFQEAEGLLNAEWLADYPHLANSIPYNLGAVLSDLGRYAEAVAARQRALAADSNNAMSYRGLALIYLRWAEEVGASPAVQVERLEQAEVYMQRALEIAPHYGGGRELQAAIQSALAGVRRR